MLRLFRGSVLGIPNHIVASAGEVANISMCLVMEFWFSNIHEENLETRRCGHGYDELHLNRGLSPGLGVDDGGEELNVGSELSGRDAGEVANAPLNLMLGGIVLGITDTGIDVAAGAVWWERNLRGFVAKANRRGKEEEEK